MTNQIKAEMFKLKWNKSFWVIVAIVTGLSALLHYLVIIDWWMTHSTAFDRAGLSELNALSLFTTLLYFNLIVSPLAGFFISTEFSQSGVIKNQVISGNKRSHIFMAKFLVYSLGSFVATILIPAVIGIVMVILLGHGDIITTSNLVYLGRSFALFTLSLLGYTAIIMLLAIITEDSGRTIIFSIIFTIVVDVVRIFSESSPFLAIIYNNTIFYQFSEVFTYTMTTGEIIKTIFIGVVTIIFITMCGVFIFNRKEIK